MKLLCTEYNDRREETFVTVGDNALLRNNDDFYIPFFAESLSCVPQLVLRVSKIGKGITERFAHRYYEEIGLGIRFYADSLEQDLRVRDLSPAAASSFDGSAAISPLKKPEVPAEEWVYSLRKNGQEVFRGTIGDLPNTPDRVISRLSGYYMLKIGDFIYCGNPFRLSGLGVGDRLQGFIGKNCLLDFKVR